jgi:hypothetical protein
MSLASRARHRPPAAGNEPQVLGYVNPDEAVQAREPFRGQAFAKLLNTIGDSRLTGRLQLNQPGPRGGLAGRLLQFLNQLPDGTLVAFQFCYAGPGSRGQGLVFVVVKAHGALEHGTQAGAILAPSGGVVRSPL